MIQDNIKNAKLVYLKTQIDLTRQKLNRAWAVNQKTDDVVLMIGSKLDDLCNEYERLIKTLK